MLSLKRDPTLQLTIGIFWVFFRHRTLIVSEAPPYNLNILVFEIFCVLFRHCTLTYCPVRYRTKEEVEKVFEQNVHRVLCPLNIFCQFMTKIFSFKRIIWMRPHCTSRINQIKSSYLTEPASRKAKPHWEEKDFWANLNDGILQFSFWPAWRRWGWRRQWGRNGRCFLRGFPNPRSKPGDDFLMW